MPDIVLQTLAGRRIDVSVGLDETLASLHERAIVAVQVPQSQLRLIYEGTVLDRQLNGALTMSDCGVVDDGAVVDAHRYLW